MPSDTHPDAARVQTDLVRAAPPARRFQLVRSLSNTAMTLSRRAIRRARPELSDEEVDLAFLALHHGEDLAQRVRAYLSRRHG